MDDLCDGIITGVAVADPSTDRVVITIDKGYSLEISAELAREHRMEEGDEISAETQQRLLVENEIDEAREVALNYLSYKPRTSSEVQRRLERDDYRPAVVDEVVADLEEREYLDDRSYARLYAEERFTGKGYGPYRVQRDLRKRGVSQDTIDRALDEVFDPESVRQEAMRQGEKRWPKLAYEENARKRAKKLYDFLARRGYPFEVIKTVVDRVADK
jgi:regulatory protein